MIKQEDCTIIIPHLGADEQQHYAFNECWTSLRQTVPDIKIIVAKNGKDYMGEPIPLDFYEHASKIALSEQGQCMAVNAAVATTNTPWIFITNDDMIYGPGWWEKLVAPVDFVKESTSFQELMCMSPKLVEPRSGAPTFLVEFCGGAGGDFDKQKFLNFVTNHTAPTPMERGFNLPLLIKRELWDTIGGYDINYDPWGSNSDSDLEYKIRLAGIQPWQNQRSLVYHFSQTSGTFNPENDSYRFKNYAYFKEKFGFERIDEGIWTADFKMPTKQEGRIFFPEWEGKYGKVY